MLVSYSEVRSPKNQLKVLCVVRCDSCQTEKTIGSRKDAKKEKHFCNTRCMGDHKRAFPERWPDNGAARNTPEACAKAMVTRKRRMDAGEIKHAWIGRKHSEASKRQMSETASNGSRLGDKNGMFGRTHSEATRSLMSDAKTQLILDGKFFAYGTRNKKGHYTSTKTGKTYFYRSGWEHKLMCYLDAEVTISTWEYESLRISYVHNDNKRWYVPDFLVTYNDQTRKLIEVKPSEFITSDRVLLKSEAALRWCSENNTSYWIITGDVLKSLGLKL